MSWNNQRGATTIELLIAMAVTGLVMGALIGVVFVSNQVLGRWQQPLSVAATRPMFELLTISIEADATVYVPCRVTASEIDFGDARCQPPYSVTYTLSGTDIVRTTPAGSAKLTHRLASTPVFSMSCGRRDPVSTGSIRVSNLVYGVGVPDLYVFFTGPQVPPC